MASHTVNVWLYYSGGWVGHDGSTNPGPFTSDKIQTQRGYSEEGQLKPSKIALTWNDASGIYHPGNPESALYGLLTHNTPCLVAADGQYTACGESSRFAPDQTPDFNAATGRGRRWVTYEAGGVLRRIGQWSDTLRSAMFHTVSRYTDLRGHWPLEEPRGAVQLSNVYPGGRPGTVSGMTFGEDGPAGAVSAAASTATSRMGGTFASTISSTAWQIGWACKLDALPADATWRPMMTWRAANGYTWSWDVNNVGWRLYVVNQDLDVIEDSSYTFGGAVTPTAWLYIRVKATISGSTVTIDAGWYQQDDPTVWGFTATYTGTLGRPTTWAQSGNAHTDGALYSHVFGVTGSTLDLQSWEAIQSFNAYNGERATDRFGRLCNQEGIFWTLVGEFDHGLAMGPQRPARFIELLQEIAATDDAMVYDRREVLGLVYRTRVDRYNQAPALELTYPGDVAPPLRELIDDLDIANRVTVSNRDGGDAVASLETGKLSVQDPPAGIGVYKSTVDVNVEDEAILSELAAYWLARQTLPGPRYPMVIVDLDANPGLATDTIEVEIGDRLTITGREPEPIDLMVIGVEASIERKRSLRTFICVPYDIFDVGIWDDAGSRYDSRTTTLAEAMTTTETLWDITSTTAADCWSTTAEPYDWLVEGERVTVTSITTPAGSGPYTQTATVTRSVNGVVKTHAIGESVRLADTKRYGLKGVPD